MNYEVSPITVTYTKKKKSLLHFIVQIFAIVGGVVAVLGIFNSVVQMLENLVK